MPRLLSPLSTVDSVVRCLPFVRMDKLPTPAYTAEPKYIDTKVALAVENMRHHMTDEGWQLFYGLGLNGYELCGHNLTINTTDVNQIIERTDPKVMVIQDKREWDTGAKDFRDPLARFTHVDVLKNRSDIFKVTVLKDAHQRPKYHAESADEMGVHAWITYYNTKIINRVAPYVRPEHVLRTYHTIDSRLVPEYTPNKRSGCLLSGAISSAYPLRQRLFKDAKKLAHTTVLPHPGYHRNGSATPGFLATLSRYKVAICTCSLYGYALRKLIEATACGCVVITNLPTDDYLPDIDGNFVRIPSDIHVNDLSAIIERCVNDYNPEQQRHYAELAKVRYDFRYETSLLMMQIEELRRNYAPQRLT